MFRDSSAGRSGVFERPYVSMHVRYGDKWRDVDFVGLESYMRVWTDKRPDIKNIFVSTGAKICSVYTF